MNATAPQAGRLADNIVHFARLLRQAGLSPGTDQLGNALRAVELIGVESREDLHNCLHSVFVSRAEQSELFDQAFQIFWRRPETMLSLSESVPAAQKTELAETLRRRLAEALVRQGLSNPATEQVSRRVDLLPASSLNEQLLDKDFESMSAMEAEQALQAMAELRLPLDSVPTRRYRSSHRGEQLDRRAMLRAMLHNRDALTLKYRRRSRRPLPLVMLCDVSGSMSQYSRMLLHFMHALSRERRRVHSFVFGTRLSHISRQLAGRDVDAALARTGAAVADWSGGTRIGACLQEFNQHWSRRLLSQGAITLLISDGLERDNENNLARQMARLARSSRRLIWLNPLLRFSEFEPRARGIRTMLPWVDEFRAAHNLNSLVELARSLSDDRALNGGARRFRG